MGKRPLGVSILAVLYGIVGFLLLLATLVLMNVVGITGLSEYLGPPLFPEMFILLFGVLTAFYFGVAYGLWHLKEWALYLLAFILFLSFFMALGTYNIITLIINGLILLYLYSVRKSFN